MSRRMPSRMMMRANMRMNMKTKIADAMKTKKIAADINLL
jgi:hypothetical protein